jgi:gluconolactonase
MNNELILYFNPNSGSTSVWQNESRQSNGLYIHDIYLYACEEAGRSVVRYDLSIGPDSREVLVSKFQSDTLRSPNDLTIIVDDLIFSDFWGGRTYSMSLNDYSLDTIPFNFKHPNGIAYSPDGEQLYVADFGTNKLYRAGVTNDRVGPMQLIVDLNNYGLSAPDGLAISKDGHIYLALFGSERMAVIEPDGSVIGYLATGPLTSNCVFAEDGKTLYITADKKLMRVVIP